MNVLKDPILRAKVHKRIRVKHEYFLYGVVYCIIFSIIMSSIAYIPMQASNGPSFIKAFIVIFLFCIVGCYFHYVYGGFNNAITDYVYLTRLQHNEKLRSKWREQFLSTTFCNVYYLYIARKYNLLSGLEYYQKKKDFLNKKHVETDELKIILQYHFYLCFNAEELQQVKDLLSSDSG